MTLVPSDGWIKEVEAAPSGTTVSLRPNTIYGPAHLVDIVRTGKGVTIDGQGATLSAGVTFEAFGPDAVEAACSASRNGHYPGIYAIAGLATLRLDRCSGLTFKNLKFIESWPTAVYIDRGTRLNFEEIGVTGSTYAFYAVRPETRNLVFRRCRWVQEPRRSATDRTRSRLWRDVPWREIHEWYDHDDKKKPYTHNRAYDGTFFLGRSIAGDVEIDHCEIDDAFNGVHLFNRDLDPKLSRNIWVHDCKFRHIRDNVLEPENLAHNWWFHDNELFNCYKPFSFELPAGGWLYVFRNRSWFDDVGGMGEERESTGTLLKLAPEDRWMLRYAGPVHFFNNSWFTRSPIAKAGSITRLNHHNNAIVFCTKSSPKDKVCGNPSVFGKPSKPGEHFTKNWKNLQIRFFNDITNHPDWPDVLKADGYELLQGVQGEPEFKDARGGNFDLRTDAPPVARGKGRPVNVELPGTKQSYWSAVKPFNVGWYQEKGFVPPKYERMRDDLPAAMPIKTMKRKSRRRGK